MTASRPAAQLLYADSERSSDMLYLGGIFIPDPFLALNWKGRSIAVLNALEIDRARDSSLFDEVLPLQDSLKAASRHFKGKTGNGLLVRWLAAKYKIPAFEIADDFPAGLALELKRAKVKLSVKSPLFPKRLVKNPAEQAALREANKASAAGLARAYAILSEAKIKGRRLFWNKTPLTSERLRTEIDICCLRNNARAAHTIVAGGDQACDPHCEGSGPLKANELIIVDIFPRNTKSGYHGDMTRTFLKGKASEPQKRLVNTVRKAQKDALSSVKSGRKAELIHRNVVLCFENNGYETGIVNGRYQGFFHSTGHGLGLDIHEAPRLSTQALTLKKGMVVTVEPGLYYPGLGGCRIEDVVAVDSPKSQILSKFHYKWQIS